MSIELKFYGDNIEQLISDVKATLKLLEGVAPKEVEEVEEAPVGPKKKKKAAPKKKPVAETPAEEPKTEEDPGVLWDKALTMLTNHYGKGDEEKAAVAALVEKLGVVQFKDFERSRGAELYAEAVAICGPKND
tara:strand:+ start:13657 stop:14055 length:399 start_codon:yes stop_codon:yes gene_type:complete